MPSIVSSLRLMCVTSNSGGQGRPRRRRSRGSGGDFHPAGRLVQHRLIRAAVAELELVGLGAAGQGQQLVPQANAEDRLLAQQAADRLAGRRPSGSGSPGPLERNTPSGCCASTSAAVAVPGRIVTRQPMSNRCRAMFHFMPKSRATTCGRVGARRGRLGGRRPSRAGPAGSAARSTGAAARASPRAPGLGRPGLGWPWPWPPGWRRRGRRVESTPFMAPRCGSGGPAPGCRCLPWPTMP